MPAILRERCGPRFDIEGMQAPETQNALASLAAMADAQMRRLDAAGVLVLAFDSTGQALMVFRKPDHGAVTDEYARAAMRQLADGEDRRERGKKRRR